MPVFIYIHVHVLVNAHIPLSDHVCMHVNIPLHAFIWFTLNTFEFLLCKVDSVIYIYIHIYILNYTLKDFIAYYITASIRYYRLHPLRNIGFILLNDITIATGQTVIYAPGAFYTLWVVTVKYMT